MRWTRETLLEEAGKYEYIQDFIKGNSTAYNAALRTGIIREMTWLKYKLNRWDDASVIEESRKYGSRSEFKRGNKTAYNIACKNKLLGRMTWLARIDTTKWTDEDIIDASKAYGSRSAFRIGSPYLYRLASKRGLLPAMTWLSNTNAFTGNRYYVYAYIDKENHVAYIGLTINRNIRHYTHKCDVCSPVHKYWAGKGVAVPDPVYIVSGVSAAEAQYFEDYYIGLYMSLGYTMLNKAKTGIGIGSIGSVGRKWTKKKVFELSRKYNSIKEFRENRPSLYNKAKCKGWIKEMTWLSRTKQPNGWWTKDRFMEEYCKAGNDRKLLRKNNMPAYRAGIKNKWL